MFSLPLLLALAASLLVHTAVFVGRQLDLSPAPELKPLTLRMVRTAPDLKAGDTPPPPQAAKAKKPRGTPVEASPQVPAQESREADAPQDNPQAAPSPTPDATIHFTGTAWPRAGRIGYALLMGEKRLPAGKTTHQWEVAEDGTYRLEALTEPMDVSYIPWYKARRMLWTSVGRVTPQGLLPETFVEKMQGRPQDNQARMNGVTAPSPETTQDVLSFIYQLGYPGAIAAGVMPVSDGTRVDAYHVEVVGEEQLDMPFGQTLRTLRIQARYGTGKEQTDVWVATERFGLPVQIRKTDPKGVVYYWVAHEIKVAVPPVIP